MVEVENVVIMVMVVVHLELGVHAVLNKCHGSRREHV